MTESLAAKSEDIKKIVADSASLNFTKIEGMPKLEHRKRGPGRPRKDGNPPGYQKIDIPAPEASAASSGPIPSPTSGDPLAPPVESFPEMEIPAAALIPVVQFPFTMLRSYTGFSGFNLPDDQAREMTPLLNAVINQYLPRVDPKHVPAMLLAGTYCTILLKQTVEFQEWKRNGGERATATAATPGNLPPIPEPRTAEESANIFARRPNGPYRPTFGNQH